MRLARIAVVVVTWNSEAVVADLLASLAASDYVGPVRTVVVDNASSDRTETVVRAAMPDAVFVQSGRNAGYAGAANLGIANAGEFDAYLLLNPDLRVQPNLITELVAELDRSDAGIVVPRLTDLDGAVRYSLRHRPTVLRAWGEAVLGGNRARRFPALGEVEGRPQRYAAPTAADWATGAAMLVSRRCAEAVGAWDERFFLYSEETDYALRAQDAGFALRYTDRATAVHHEGDSHQSPELYALLVGNRVRLMRKRHGVLRTGAFWLGVLCGELVRSGGATHRRAVRALFGPGAPWARAQP